MKRYSSAIILLLVLSIGAVSQVKPRPRTAKPTPTPDASKGTVSGRTYSNKKFGFQIVFPDTWLIPDKDFEAYMKSRGFDLGLKAPETLTPTGQAKINRAVENVGILLTVYRSMPGTPNNAVMRVSVEDLSLNPQIKDAVDYIDAMRATFASLKLPDDFEYSETQAERLGAMQFGYIDTRSKNVKKRMYATVRNGRAVLFTLTYYADEDLEAMRRILTEGNFDYK